MCGICGIIDIAGTHPPTIDEISRMCRAIVHRGPDEEGMLVEGHVGLGNRRLSIIDLSGGHQPIYNEDGTIAVVFNGEIYNFRELRIELEARGHRFSTSSDTEVIVHAYEEHGDDCVNRFRGMFAFVLWDRRSDRFLCARDPIGKKPFYYAEHQGRFLFGSELKSLLTCQGFRPPIDPTALDCFMALEYVPAPRTILQGVYKLPGGHLLTLQRGQIDVRPYWDIQFEPSDEPEAVLAERLRETVKLAVKRRLVSDVPLGAFLSGGIDSSIVVGLMSELMDRPVQTFSIGFSDGSYNELGFARQIAQRFHTDHHEMVISPDIVELATNLLAHIDEPLADTSIFPTYLVSAFARQSVTVALSGDGGDELFGGYDWYVADRLARYYQRLPRPVRSHVLPAVVARIPPSRAKKGVANLTRRFVQGAALPEDLQHARWMIYLDKAERDRLYTRDLRSAVAENDPFDVVRHYLSRPGIPDRLSSQIYADIKTFLVDDIMVKVDRMSMAASLEARAPLLDRDVVDFAATLPCSAKIRGFERKYLLKQAFADMLPDTILRRKKQGFSSPVKNWMRAELRPMMSDVLSVETLQRQGYFEPACVHTLIDQHLAGTHDHGHRLWSLMVFGLWYEQYHQPEMTLPEAQLGREALRYGSVAAG